MILLLAFACSSPSDDSASSPLDLRLVEGEDYPAPGGSDLVFRGPDLVIEPYTDMMYCTMETYTGEDIGLNDFNSYQDATFGHHFILLGSSTSAIDYPDGTGFDCTSTEDLSMDSLEPIMLPTGGNQEVVGIALPPGTATKLRSGQRYVMQSHYVNTGDRQILVNDVAVSATIPVDEVEVWAAPVVMNHQEFEIPAGEEATISFDCLFEPQYNFLYLAGHMHEWGKHITLERVVDDVVVETLYDTEWDASYRDLPPLVDYGAGYALPEFTTLRTTCTWFNDTDETLAFPAEMCDHVAMAWPALTSDICTD
ncbi:MAG: hypothetical protein EXR69_09045 [Myxococcales bacterium]|nr:hypothetical protein [Myxococcales bacterium]